MGRFRSYASRTLAVAATVLALALGAGTVGAQNDPLDRTFGGSVARPGPVPQGAASPVVPSVRAGADRAPAGPRAGVRLLPGSASSIRFVVDVPEAAFAPHANDPATLSLELDGYETLGRPGEPAMPRRIVNVAVPPRGDVRVRAIGLDAAVRDGALLAPQPLIERGREDAARYDRRAEVYESAGGIAPQRARLVGVSWMRHQRVAQIEILPADYDPARGRVQVYGRVEVEVDVAPAGASLRPGAAEGPDAFEGAYRGVLINYDQGRAWRSRRGAVQPEVARGSRLADPLGAAAIEVTPDTSVFAGRLWAKIAIDATGFYKVRFATLRNMAIFGQSTTTHLDSVRLFTWPGFPVLPEFTYCDSCDYREVAIQFVEGGDTLFNANDEYFYFFAMGASDWANLYDPTHPDTTFINNPYERTNYYYLAVGTAAEPVGGVPKRIGTRSGAITNPSATVPATFEDREHFELDLEYFPDPTPAVGGFQGNTHFWEKWYWRSLSLGQSFSTMLDVPAADTTQPVRMRLSGWGVFTSNPCFPDPDHFMDVTLNGLPSPAARRGWRFNTGHVIDTTFAGNVLRESGNVVTVSVPAVPTCPTRIDRIALAWINLNFQRRFVARNDELRFRSPAAAGDYLYRVTGFTVATLPRVFDVTDAYDPVEILNLTYEDLGGTYRLSFESVEPGLRRYRVIQPSSIVELTTAKVADAPVTSLENLRSPALGADYLVIYFDGFRAAADSLAAWRSARLPLQATPPPYQTRAVPVSALYDQFSGGRTDPAAIRNFLRAVFANWTRLPSFVTFLGDASYDFKNYSGRALPGNPGTLVPSYEGGYDFLVQRQFATDDWLLNVDNPVQVIPDFFGGRVPAGDAASALVYVRDKLFFYERQAPVGEYRNKVMLIADDDKQGERDDNLRWTHVQQSGQLDTLSTPVHVDREYVYLHKFPDGPGATKPAAKAAIISNINRGVGMLNYIGHGSPFKMADESVFLDTDTGTLTNAQRFTVFVAASCDIGKFNDPAVESLGERLVLEAAGGAVGVVSATELAFSNQNATLNRVVYENVFDRDSVAQTGQYHRSFAEALLVAKAGSLTQQKYQLMGDAGLRLNLPRLWSQITLWDSAGTAPVTELARGQTVTFRGQVLDQPGGTLQSFNGVAKLVIEDSAPFEQTPPCTFDPNCSNRPFYYHAAGPMFRGDVGVNGGTFEGRFVVPLEAKLGARGRARAYLEGQVSGESFTSDGVGAVRAQLSPGGQTTSDSEGPRITLSFAGGGTVVKPDAVLQIDLFDPSGILTTGHTPQNGIVVTLDDNTTARVDVTSSFRYAADSHQSGTAFFTLPGLSQGAHTVKVSAADNLAAGLSAGTHRSSATLAFLVQDSPPLEISRAYLFPNPTQSGGPRSGGQFIVDTPGDSVNVLIRIYTVSGKLIRVLKSLGGIGQVQIPWDGRDAEGFSLANGVYIFKVHANPRDETGASDAAQKATSVGRIVIVNP